MAIADVIDEAETAEKVHSLDISLDNSPLNLDNGAHRLGSVWEVLETYAWPLVNHVSALQGIRNNLEERFATLLRTNEPSAADFRQQDRDNFRVVAENFGLWLKSHELLSALDCLKRIEEEFSDDEPSIQELISRLRMFNEILEDELRRRVFLFVVPEDANLYRSPLASFSLTWGAYPSTRPEIDEACRCYALGRYTACVFHCMAILQSGLYALAGAAGATLRYPIELAEWQDVLSAIEKKIEPMRNEPRSAARDERVKFFSECAVQFRYFKDAWRNHVAHMRETYDRDQTHSILLHVRDFMEKLSTRVGEGSPSHLPGRSMLTSG